MSPQSSVRPEPVEGRAAGATPAIRPSPSLGANASSSQAKTGANAKGLARDTLDAGWDKKLRTGVVAPDMVIDLHGFTVAAAHAALEAGLSRAVAGEARLILLVTGRPPPPGRSRLDNPLRGVIRASIGDWLHHSRHAPRIAAVRNAHPRHGGAGALYVILRRVRG